MSKRNAGKKRDLEQAARNHIDLYGPSTSAAIAASGKLNSGKLLKDTRSGMTGPQVTALLKSNSSFKRIYEGNTVKRRSADWVWALTD